MRIVGDFFILMILTIAGGALASPTSDAAVSAKKISDTQISIETAGSGRLCRIDAQVVDVKKSSDGRATIISGTSYVLTADLLRCKPDRAVHAMKAAPHVGFLADVNVKSGVYASLIPVSVNPMSFVAVVAKIGSDKNLINLSGFYRSDVRRSTLLYEASADMAPTISLDGRYVSLKLHACDSDVGGYVPVFEIMSGREVKLSHSTCEVKFAKNES